NPASMVALENRARMKLAAGDPDGAMGDANELIRRTPTSASGYRVRSSVRRSKLEFADALSDIEAYLRIAPDNPNSYEHRGYNRFMMGDYASAIVDRMVAVQRNSKSAYPMLFLYLARAQRDKEGAVLELEVNAIELDPKKWPFAVVEM